MFLSCFLFFYCFFIVCLSVFSSVFCCFRFSVSCFDFCACFLFLLVLVFLVCLFCFLFACVVLVRSQLVSAHLLIFASSAQLVYVRFLFFFVFCYLFPVLFVPFLFVSCFLVRLASGFVFFSFFGFFLKSNAKFCPSPPSLVLLPRPVIIPDLTMTTHSSQYQKFAE